MSSPIRISIGACAIAIAFTFTSHANAEVFRCRDANGKTTYAQSPCASGTGTVIDATPNGSPSGEARQIIRVTTKSQEAPAVTSSGSAQAKALDGNTAIGTQKTCDKTYKQEKEGIDARMRAGYSSAEGEMFRERLRQIEKSHRDCLAQAKGLQNQGMR